MLRPGNAGSNDTNHHLELLDQALGGLPAEYQAGHDVGDLPHKVIHPILVRADSAGATHGFLRGIDEANCDFSIGYPIGGRVRDALLLVQEEDWQPVIEADGSIREAHRSPRSPLSSTSPRGQTAPGRSLAGNGHIPEPSSPCLTPPKGSAPHVSSPTPEGTTSVPWDCVIEDMPGWRIGSEPGRTMAFPTCPLRPTCATRPGWRAAWVAGALLAWCQLVCFDGELSKIEPKTKRHRILHVAALLVRRQRGLVLRLDETWPWARDLVQTFVRLRAAIP
jgi:hypothetical protein